MSVLKEEYLVIYENGTVVWVLETGDDFFLDDITDDLKVDLRALDFEFMNTPIELAKKLADYLPYSFKVIQPSLDLKIGYMFLRGIA